MIGPGAHGRVRRRYGAPEEFQVPANRVDFSSALGIGDIERFLCFYLSMSMVSMVSSSSSTFLFRVAKLV